MGIGQWVYLTNSHITRSHALRYGVHTSPICKGFKLSILFPPHSQAEPGNALREASPPVTPIELSLWGFVPRLCLGTMKPALGILVCTP
jgi:hypothetical protein